LSRGKGHVIEEEKTFRTKKEAQGGEGTAAPAASKGARSQGKKKGQQLGVKERGPSEEEEAAGKDLSLMGGRNRAWNCSRGAREFFRNNLGLPMSSKKRRVCQSLFGKA